MNNNPTIFILKKVTFNSILHKVLKEPTFQTMENVNNNGLVFNIAIIDRRLATLKDGKINSCL